MEVTWEVNRLSVVPAFQTFSCIGNPFLVPDGERIVGSWWAVEGDLSAVLNEEDRGPRHGAGAGFRETAIADGLVRLRVTPTRLIGTISAGATTDGHVRGSGTVGMNVASSRLGRDQGLEFYWPLVDIDLVGVLKTKKYRQWWDHEFYVQCEEPRAVLQLRNVRPKGPAKDWAVQRGLTGQSGSGTSMDGLAQCLVEAVTAARGEPARRERTSSGPDEETGWLWAVPESRSVWHDDPTGRYQQRWWDGTGWTPLVFTRDNTMAIDDHQDQSYRDADLPTGPPDGPESDAGDGDGETDPSPEAGNQLLTQSDALAAAVKDPAHPTADDNATGGQDRVLPPLPDRANPVVVVDDPLLPNVSTHKSQREPSPRRGPADTRSRPSSSSGRTHRRRRWIPAVAVLGSVVLLLLLALLFGPDRDAYDPDDPVADHIDDLVPPSP